MHGEGFAKHRGGLAILLPREMAEALPREGAEVPGLSRQDLVAVGDRSTVVAREETDGGSLVPPFGELGRELNDPAENRFGAGDVLVASCSPT